MIRHACRIMRAPLLKFTIEHTTIIVNFEVQVAGHIPYNSV